MSGGKCSCGCSGRGKKPEYTVSEENGETTLAELPVGAKATIAKIMPAARGRKKFADVGLVAGAELEMEAHAPFGGLLRVRVMETSMAIHSEDAANIVMKKETR